MAGYTDSCARRMAKRCGAGLVISEMVSAAGIKRKANRTLALLAFHPEETPLGIQIFGADPAEMAEAARIVQDKGASLVDINLGCPVKKVCRNGAGAALLREPLKVARIVQSVRTAVDCALTVKMRLGWDAKQIFAPEIASIAEDCGADAIALHPRTRAQAFLGQADWTWVARLKDERRIPVLGSGDIATPLQASEVLRKGICDGVMIGRAARGNPWLFAQTLDLLAGIPATPLSTELRYQGILQHLDWIFDLYGKERGLKRNRYMLQYYAKGLPGSARFRRQLFAVQDENELRKLLEEYFQGVQGCSPTS